MLLSRILKSTVYNNTLKGIKAIKLQNPNGAIKLPSYSRFLSTSPLLNIKESKYIFFYVYFTIFKECFL